MRSGCKNAVPNFRKAALSELKKLRVAWPELEYDLVHGALVLKPSLSRIPKARSRLT